MFPLAAAVILGAGTGIYTYAHAATSTDTSTSSTTSHVQSGSPQQFDPSQGDHVGRNGVKEILLTGDAASKALSAALAAVHGATIERVETDAE